MRQKMLKIAEIVPVSKATLKVIFENGDVKICDISQFMEKGAFKELKEESLFKRLRNTGFSVEWPNEIDLSSDTLYNIGQ
jgi:hypothetical protein